jgi:hypothetical protein
MRDSIFACILIFRRIGDCRAVFVQNALFGFGKSRGVIPSPW